MAARRALVVGIESYAVETRLRAASTDAGNIATLLTTHGDGTANWDVTPLIEDPENPQRSTIKGRALVQRLTTLFLEADKDDELLFYFSGHAVDRPWGGEFVAFDGPAISFNDLMGLINRSESESIVVILDCCISGQLGIEDPGPRTGPGSKESTPTGLGVDPFRPDRATIRDGLAILTASRSYEDAVETGASRNKIPVGAFTELLIAGLDGGAADALGSITALDLYAYATQGFDETTQRPTLKTHLAGTNPLRIVEPRVPWQRFRKILDIFPMKDSTPKLSQAHEYDKDDPTAINRESGNYPPFGGSEKQVEHDHIKLYRDAGWVVPADPGLDFWHVTSQRKHVKLTAVGQFYWEIAYRRVQREKAEGRNH